jgi:hypothetical protein
VQTAINWLGHFAPSRSLSKILWHLSRALERCGPIVATDRRPSRNKESALASARRRITADVELPCDLRWRAGGFVFAPLVFFWFA